LSDFHVDDITGADYILCTHTHYDHTSDIGYLAKKFGGKVFIGEMSIGLLSEYFDMDYANLYPVGNGEVFELEDLTIQAFRAKHVGHPGHAFPSRAASDRFGLEGYGGCDQVGWLELFDFVITTNNNFRFMIVTGIRVNQHIYTQARTLRPNMVIRQTLGMPDEYAGVMAPFGAQVYLPNHHENIGKTSGMPTEQYMEQTRRQLQQLDPYAAFISPEPYQWYDLSISVTTAASNAELCGKEAVI